MSIRIQIVRSLGNERRTTPKDRRPMLELEYCPGCHRRIVRSGHSCYLNVIDAQRNHNPVLNCPGCGAHLHQPSSERTLRTVLVPAWRIE